VASNNFTGTYVGIGYQKSFDAFDFTERSIRSGINTSYYSMPDVKVSAGHQRRVTKRFYFDIEAFVGVETAFRSFSAGINTNIGFVLLNG